jgi:hypothetical protein
MDDMESGLMKSLILAMAKCCPICGTRLITVEWYPEKECPHFHGRMHVTEDDDGLPILAFRLHQGV